MKKYTKELGEVEKIVLIEDGGWVYPHFILENGDRYRERLTATGHCWALSWELVKEQENQ